MVTRPAARGKGPDEVYRVRHEIEVNRNQAPLDRYVTLVHELAHQHCGHLGTPDPKLWPQRYRPGATTRDEIEAESIVYMIISRLDPDVEMGDYILGHVRDCAETPANIELNLMFKVAGDIIEMGKKRLPARPSDDARAAGTG